ncbi:hypothetical protein AXF42_Ash012445 [Apostasia shenzhenica]|uniref:Uncharacterized protein n=1 Tax=Apostasia shenzhenica TaxID=1088818 RepID=A0A2I0AR12_9ASPA|nr:hypothetical protein AXF42_Ash012445 [Apostasia shenzhenica]
MPLERCFKFLAGLYLHRPAPAAMWFARMKKEYGAYGAVHCLRSPKLDLSQKTDQVELLSLSSAYPYNGKFWKGRGFDILKGCEELLQPIGSTVWWELKNRKGRYLLTTVHT